MRHISLVLLGALFILGALTVPLSEAQTLSCPTFDGQQTRAISATECEFGPVQDPVTAPIPAGFTADYWDSNARAAVKNGQPGTPITTVHATFRQIRTPTPTPTSLTATTPTAGTCPVFGTLTTRRLDGVCKLDELPSPVWLTIPQGWNADYWDNANGREVKDAAGGTTIYTVVASFREIPSPTATPVPPSIGRLLIPLGFMPVPAGECPTFAGVKTTKRLDGLCEFGPVAIPVTDTVAGGFEAGYWDTALGRAENAPAGRQIYTVHATFKRLAPTPPPVPMPDPAMARCPNGSDEAFRFLGGEIAEQWHDLGNQAGYRQWYFKGSKGNLIWLRYHNYGDFDTFEGNGLRRPVRTDEATYNCR